MEELKTMVREMRTVLHEMQTMLIELQATNRALVKHLQIIDQKADRNESVARTQAQWVVENDVVTANRMKSALPAAIVAVVAWLLWQ